MGKITKIKEKETGKLRTIKDYDPITGGYLDYKYKSQEYHKMKDSAAYIRDNFDFIDVTVPLPSLSNKISASGQGTTFLTGTRGKWETSKITSFNKLFYTPNRKLLLL